MRRPRARRSISARAASTSGSSGEDGLVVVELEHPDRAVGGGVNAQPAQDALVDIALDDLHAGVAGREDVDRADLGELRRERGVARHAVEDLDADEDPVLPHARAPIRSLISAGICEISSATTIPASA